MGKNFILINDNKNVGQVKKSFKDAGFEAWLHDKHIDSNCKLKDVYAKEEVEVVVVEEIEEEEKKVSDLLAEMEDNLNDDDWSDELKSAFADSYKEDVLLDCLERGTDEEKAKALKLLDDFEEVADTKRKADEAQAAADTKRKADEAQAAADTKRKADEALAAADTKRKADEALATAKKTMESVKKYFTWKGYIEFWKSIFKIRN